jgi:hypothetical protein
MTARMMGESSASEEDGEGSEEESEGEGMGMWRERAWTRLLNLMIEHKLCGLRANTELERELGMSNC